MRAPPAVPKKKFGGHSMVVPLLRALVCPPENAGWGLPERVGRWRGLGYLRRPDFNQAQAQHGALRRELEGAGAEVFLLPGAPSLGLDAAYCHDASFVTNFGAICLHMGKRSRMLEPRHHGDFYQSHGIPVIGKILRPGSVEAGDLIWLDDTTLLAGRGHRTNAAGIQQLRALLKSCGVEVLSAPLPYGTGPHTCLHLMSLVSLLDSRTALVDLSGLSVETVELLSERGFRLVEIDPNERGSLAVNVLALGHGKLLAIEENKRTNAVLRKLGFEVRTFSGTAIAINGGGGPTCLVRPILRG